MKKKGLPKKYKAVPKKEALVNEPRPAPGYRPVKALPQVADFPYRKFARVAGQVPFTQKEWAGILHLSEKRCNAMPKTT